MDYDTIQRLHEEVSANGDWEAFEYRSVSSCSMGKAQHVAWATHIPTRERVQFQSWRDWERAKAVEDWRGVPDNQLMYLG